jgi:hypothetical protein
MNQCCRCFSCSAANGYPFYNNAGGRKLPHSGDYLFSKETFSDGDRIPLEAPDGNK